MPERDIFGAYEREHARYIYFLLASAAAAIGFALSQLLASSSPHWCILAAHVLPLACWAVSFRIGCQRLRQWLVALYRAVKSHAEGFPDVVGDGSSSARCQLGWLFAGMVLYAALVFAKLFFQI